MKNRSWVGVLLDLFQQSIIIQSLLTLTVVGVAGYMMLVGRPISDQWWGLVTLVVGYWVGSKGNFQQTQVSRELMTAMQKQTEAIASISNPTPPEV